MPRAEMLTVFSYDVSEDRRRRKIADVLEDAAVRVQQSVFEARLDQAAAERLAAHAARELGPGDSLRVYAVGAHGRARSLAYGGAPLPEAQEFWLL